jgi:hypothetical protein
MARKIGASITHPLLPRTKVDIRLDINEFLFTAEFMGQEFSDTDGHNLRRKVLDAMEEHVTSGKEPMPTISIRLSGLFVRRYWHCGNIRWEWDKSRSTVLRHSIPDTLPYIRKYGGSPSVVYVPYAESLWELLSKAENLDSGVNEVIRNLALKQHWMEIRRFVEAIEQEIKEREEPDDEETE